MRRTLGRRLPSMLALGAVAAAVTGVAPSLAATGGTCATSTPAGASYTVTVCITAPAANAVLTGDVTVTATANVSSGGAKVSRLEFGIDGPAGTRPLLTDFVSPWTFTLPSADFPDGSHTLYVHAVMRDGNVSQETTQTDTFSNGTAGVPPLPSTSRDPVTGTTPSSGAPFVVAAVGDGAGGESNETNVVSLIQSWHPNLLTWLGDVYDNGTYTEFKNWYDPSGYYGAFKSITDPVVGNHEYGDTTTTTPKARGYFYYWQNIPHYYSYNAGGWHFVALDSTSQYMGSNGQTTAAQQQFTWFQNDLDANTQPCVAVYYHHPLYTIGAEGPSTRMLPYWNVMAAHHVTLVLNGHEHDYQRWTPLDGNGNPDPNGVTEFVVGTGGHSAQPPVTTDSRVAYAPTSQVYGALRLNLTLSSASYSFVKTTGSTTSTLDSGSIPCRGTDTGAPTVPGNVTATVASGSQTSVQVGWAPSTDNIAVTGYDVYRDGTKVATLGASAGSYTDTGLQPGSTHSYTVDAFDAAGNHSAQSSPASVRLPASDTTAPTTPTGLTATAVSGTEVDLAWTGSTDDTGVTGYHVYRDGNLLATTSGSVTSYHDTTVAPATHYSYTVSAFDAAFNESPQSSAAGVTTPGTDSTPPSTPGNVTATTSPNGYYVSVGLTWTASTDNVALDHYDVYRDGTKIGTVAAGTTSYTDSTAQGSTTYTYGIVAVDTSALQSQPGTVSVTTPAATPLTTTALDGGDSYVTSSSPDINYGTATSLQTDSSPTTISYLRFNVTGALSQISAATLKIYGTTKSQAFSVYTVPDASWTEGGVTYNTRPTLGALVGTSAATSGAGWVSVDVSPAVAGNGWVDLAVVSSSSTVSKYSSREASSNQPTLVVQSFPYGSSDTTAPSVPGNVTATATGQTTVQVSWAASTDDVGVTGYDVYRDGAPLATVGASSGSFTDTGLTPGTTYHYTVDAFDAAGNHSAQSTAVSATTPAADTTAPSVPGNVTATANSGTDVTVSWTAATDNVGVAGYRVYRNGALLTTTGATTTTYDDQTVAAGTQYSYTVSAFDAAGNSSAQSPAATVTTPSSSPQTVNAADVGDTYVNGGSATSNYGTSTSLKTDTSPDTITYLRFDLRSISSTITSKTLQIYGTSKSQAFTVYQVADGSWSESATTYNTRPSLGAQVGTSPANSGAGWVTVDVSSAAVTSGYIDLAIVSSSSTNSSYSSREASTNQPVLVVQTS